MSLIRINLELAIPTGSITPQRKIAIRDKIREWKALAVKINEGKLNEEMTVKAVWHICHHDEEGVPCESEVEI